MFKLKSVRLILENKFRLRNAKNYLLVEYNLPKYLYFRNELEQEKKENGY